MTDIAAAVRDHPFLAQMPVDVRDVLADCAAEAEFPAGAMLLREGEPANHFYLILDGRVSMQLTVPGRPPLVVQTIGPGDVVGLSWLVPMNRSAYDARAQERTRTIAVSTPCLYGKCEADAGFGYALLKAFMPPLVRRLQDTRLRLLDVYESHA
ncbi:MAG: cyclic nucleotide-binding domain-containing protein [Geminicoccaceae bacterium]